MKRVLTASSAADVANGTQVTVKLTFPDADLKAVIGSAGGWAPRWGLGLAISAGTISKITKVRARSAEDEDQGVVVPLKTDANGLTVAQFDRLLDLDGSGLDLPKLPVLGGYVLELTCDVAGGGGSETVSLTCVGYNASHLEETGLLRSRSAGGWGLSAVENNNPNATSLSYPRQFSSGVMPIPGMPLSGTSHISPGVLAPGQLR